MVCRYVTISFLRHGYPWAWQSLSQVYPADLGFSFPRLSSSSPLHRCQISLCPEGPYVLSLSPGDSKCHPMFLNKSTLKQKMGCHHLKASRPVFYSQPERPKASGSHNQHSQTNSWNLHAASLGTRIANSMSSHLFGDTCLPSTPGDLAKRNNTFLVPRGETS